MSTGDLQARHKGLSLFLQGTPNLATAERYLEQVGIIETIIHERLQQAGALVTADETEQRERFEALLDGFEVEAEGDDIEQAAREMREEEWAADELRHRREWGLE